jgi:mono/diheme cytochrome c family protein
MVDGELFDVITHGRRTMPGYRFQIPERDRWAIVAYVRALQRATSGTIEDVPADLRGELR